MYAEVFAKKVMFKILDYHKQSDPPTIPALFAATGLLHCSFIILSNGFPFAPPPPFLEYVFLL